MELNPRQQKLAFAVIVVILAGLGVYLLLPQRPGAPTAATSPPATAATTPAQPATIVPQQQPVTTPSPATSGSVNIFQWLPFSAADLAKASSVAAQAAAYYDTYSYKESAAAYGSRLSGLVTTQYLRVLEEGYSTFGVVKQRTSDKEISNATATINSLRGFDQSSITFVVTISRSIRRASGTSSPSGQYAITVVRTGGTWLVNQIQPASAGNQ